MQFGSNLSFSRWWSTGGGRNLSAVTGDRAARLVVAGTLAFPVVVARVSAPCAVGSSGLVCPSPGPAWPSPGLEQQPSLGLVHVPLCLVQLAPSRVLLAPALVHASPDLVLVAPGLALRLRSLNYWVRAPVRLRRGSPLICSMVAGLMLGSFVWAGLRPTLVQANVFPLFCPQKNGKVERKHAGASGLIDATSQDMTHWADVQFGSGPGADKPAVGAGSPGLRACASRSFDAASRDMAHWAGVQVGSGFGAGGPAVGAGSPGFGAGASGSFDEAPQDTMHWAGVQVGSGFGVGGPAVGTWSPGLGAGAP